MENKVGNEDLRKRISGSFVGAASGDVLGAAVEFQSHEQIVSKYGNPGISDFTTGGPFGFKLGEITDDTQQAILLAEALLEHDGTADDFWKRFGDKLVTWRATAQDVGSQTAQGIRMYHDGATFLDMLKIGPRTRPSNGAVMRVYPVAFMYYDDPERMIQYTRLATAITHPHPEAVACAIMFNMMVAGMLTYPVNMEDFRINAFYDMYKIKANNFLSDDEKATIKSLEEFVIRTTPVHSYTLAREALQVAFFYATRNNTEMAIISACSFGGDNDTHGAVAGALAGLAGIDNLPRRWVTKIVEIDHIIELSDKITDYHVNKQPVS